MTWTRRLALCLLLTTPVQAEPLHGAADPAYQAAFESLLSQDDATALKTLHDLAQSGNIAALITLPTAQNWLRADETLDQIDSSQVKDPARAVLKPADLWRNGTASVLARDQLNRAMWLYELGEDRKADYLFANWVARMPETAALPDGFQDMDAAPELLAKVLLQHLNRGDRKALPVLQDWLDQDRIEGWMVYAELSDHYLSDGGQPMISSLRIGSNARARLPDGRIAAHFLWHPSSTQNVDTKTVAVVLADLLPRSSYAPLRAYCAARCPITQPECAAAFVGVLGRLGESTPLGTPLLSVMTQDRFFATLRGEQVLVGWSLQGGIEPDHTIAAPLLAPAYLDAKSRNSCFAEGVLRALRPFPTRP